jgi:hypothetical protein
MSGARSGGGSELLREVTAILDALGPFRDNAPRTEKWRTTEQLAGDVGLATAEGVDRLDGVLLAHEAACLASLDGDPPIEPLVRRAKYPDRTTALALWGSVRWHGPPWTGHTRTDDPDDEPRSLRVPEGAAGVFLSHTAHDRLLALAIAEAFAKEGIASWRFETDIEYGLDIAQCVRSAIADASAIVAVLTGYSIASLWVLTELHTSLALGQRIGVVLHTDNPILTNLLESATYPHPEGDFDTTVQFSTDAVSLLETHYRRTETQSRGDRYAAQVADFLATMPMYLRSWQPRPDASWMPLYAFPHMPNTWDGDIALRPFADLAASLQRVG